MTAPSPSRRSAGSALEHRHGEAGASYLEHLRAVSANRYVQEAIRELEREAEDQESGTGSSASSTDR